MMTVKLLAVLQSTEMQSMMQSVLEELQKNVRILLVQNNR